MKIMFDNTPDPKTGRDASEILDMAIQEVYFLAQIFGRLPPLDWSMEEISGGIHAVLTDIREKLEDIDGRLFYGEKEVTL